MLQNIDAIPTEQLEKTRDVLASLTGLDETTTAILVQVCTEITKRQAAKK